MTYGKLHTPVYPAEIFYDQTILKLLPATDKHLKTFVEIERPSLVPQAQFPSNPVSRLLEKYSSIGEFYNEVIHGLIILDQRYKKELGSQLFNPVTSKRQLQEGDSFWPSSDPDSKHMKAVTNLDTATSALRLIITQGDGGIAEDLLCDANRKKQAALPSHYEIFQHIVELKPECYDLVENPITSEFVGLRIHPVMVLFDAVYSYLLKTIEILWQCEGQRRQNLIKRNMMPLMQTIMGNIASFLITHPAYERSPDLEPASTSALPQAVLENGKCAAPPFNRYDFVTANPLLELMEAAERACKAYSDDEDDLDDLGKIRKAISKLYPLPKLE